MSVERNLKLIEERIEAACARSGRKREDVLLVGVSKLQSTEKIREAHAAGLRDFAENYLQEALEKQDELLALNLRWHFIGRIQSKKAKALAGKFALIHSVDRPEIADIINRQELQRPQEILLQYNVAAEDSKGGASESALRELFEDCCEHENIRVMGLMVMPPLTENPENVRTYFKKARDMRDSLRSQLNGEMLKIHPMSALSMGTTQDFEVAIEEGATCVRIGTSIFGERQ
jgi:pyridoxal phosphate enzyme (YggS family)